MYQRWLGKDIHELSARRLGNGNQGRIDWFPLWLPLEPTKRPAGSAGQFSNCSLERVTERALGLEPTIRGDQALGFDVVEMLVVSDGRTLALMACSLCR
jgi:hypothetical protein